MGVPSQDLAQELRWVGAGVREKRGAQHEPGSVLRVWRVGRLGEARLPLAHVPVQTLRQALEPVVHQVMAADGRHGVARRGDLDAKHTHTKQSG